MTVATLQPEDVGALCRIDAAALLAALAIPRHGKTYDLGLELNAAIPHNRAFTRFAHLFTHTPEGTGAASPFQFSADSIIGALHVGTHMDALIHVQAEDRIYGGALAREVRTDSGWTQFGMETVGPIVGRGLVIDVPAFKGLQRLADRYEITVGDLQGSLETSGQSVRPGDIVLVRTGKIQDWPDPDTFQAAEPGVGRDAAIWLFEAGMAVLGSDTTGTEPLPFRDAAASTHRAMLVDRGVHLLENLDLEQVSADRVTEGLFMALPLKITGATGSWIRPALIV